MKKFTLLIYILFISAILKAQDVNDSGYLHPTKFSLIGQEIFFPEKSFISFGIQLEASIGRHLYLNYHFALGTTSQGGLYAHSTMGGAGGAALLFNNPDIKGIGYAAVILLFIPEGIGFEIPLGKKSELVPYLNPAQVDYRTLKAGGEEFNFSGDAGCRYVFNMPKSHFFQIHLGAKLLYNNGEWGIEGGASVGKFF